MRQFSRPLLKHLTCLLLLALAGCSSIPQNVANENWIHHFTPDSAESTSNQIPYDIARVERDAATLDTLTDEFINLTGEVASLKRALSFRKQPYLSDSENKQIEMLLFRSINAGDALADIVRFYRNNTATDEATHTKGAVIGMSAGLTRSYYNSYYCALFHNRKDLTKLLNSAHPSYDLPAGSYDALYDRVTSLDNMELLALSWYLFCKDLETPNSTLNQLKASDPVYAKRIEQLDTLYAGTHIQTRYVLHSSRHSLPDLENRLHHSEIAKLAEEADASLKSGTYSTRGFIFKNVARIQKPDTHLLEFSEAQAQHIKETLQPGDIILTFSAGYMSNVFLPGKFKHGITYIGSVEDRRNAGLTDAALTQAAISKQQAANLIKHVNVTTMEDHYDVDIIEAVAEGVVMHSLDKLLETHINRMVVIRPNITDQERTQQLIKVFQYVDTAYDFKFDFQDDSYQCCTEVVYRTTNGKGEIDFSLVKMKGRWILAADDILRYYLEQKPNAFEFILLADQPSTPNDYHAEILEGADGLTALYQLMEIDQQAAQQTENQ